MAELQNRRWDLQKPTQTSFLLQRRQKNYRFRINWLLQIFLLQIRASYIWKKNCNTAKFCLYFQKIVDFICVGNKNRDSGRKLSGFRVVSTPFYWSYNRTGSNVLVLTSVREVFIPAVQPVTAKWKRKRGGRECKKGGKRATFEEWNLFFHKRSSVRTNLWLLRYPNRLLGPQNQVEKIKKKDTGNNR